MIGGNADLPLMQMKNTLGTGQGVVIMDSIAASAIISVFHPLKITIWSEWRRRKRSQREYIYYVYYAYKKKGGLDENSAAPKKCTRHFRNAENAFGLTPQRSSAITATRPTLSQYWSFKIRRTTFLKYMKFADLLIVRHLNCEKAGRSGMATCYTPAAVAATVVRVLNMLVTSVSVCK